jgi:hypothetical protein
MCLGGVDDVVALVEPIAHELVDQCRRMLPIAVHEQDGAQAGVVEAGEQRRLLAEIAGQRKHLNVEVVGRKFARNGKRSVAAAVVDIDDLGRQPAGRLEGAGGLDEARVQGGEIGRLVEQRHDDGKAGVCSPRSCGDARTACPGHRIGYHQPRL